MRYIDAFNHFNPKRYFDALIETPAGQKDIGKRVRGIPALYDLWWDPGENYDIVFNGAAPTRGDFKTSPGRYSGEDNGWIGLYINPPMDQLWEEIKTHPNIPYKPFGAGTYEQIPPAYR